MITLLTNRSFQVFVIILAALAAVSTLLAIGTLTNDNLLYTIVGIGIGIPLSTAPPVTVTPVAAAPPATPSPTVPPVA